MADACVMEIGCRKGMCVCGFSPPLASWQLQSYISVHLTKASFLCIFIFLHLCVCVRAISLL